MASKCPYPSSKENPMKEARSKASSPMFTKPKYMTVKVKVKGK
jgi:hypothetical protein